MSSTSIFASTACPIAWTSRLSWSPAHLDSDLRAAGDVLLELVDVVGDAAPRLVPAELMRKIDVDGL